MDENTEAIIKAVIAHPSEISTDVLKWVYAQTAHYAGSWGVAHKYANHDLQLRGWWCGKDGTWVRIADMDNSRLLNTGGYIVKAIREWHTEQERLANMSIAFPRTDAGWDTVDWQDDRLPDPPRNIEYYLQNNPALVHIVNEAQRRGIVDRFWSGTTRLLKQAGLITSDNE